MPFNSVWNFPLSVLLQHSPEIRIALEVRHIEQHSTTSWGHFFGSQTHPAPHWLAISGKRKSYQRSAKLLGFQQKNCLRKFLAKYFWAKNFFVQNKNPKKYSMEFIVTTYSSNFSCLQIFSKKCLWKYINILSNITNNTHYMLLFNNIISHIVNI